MQVKICGLRDPAQAQAIAALGFRTFGFICVEASPRYVTPAQIQLVLDPLQSLPHLQAIGVFANVSLESIQTVIENTALTGIQLHGDESPDFCQRVKRQFPQHPLIKALRIRDAQDLQQPQTYSDTVDVLLLDAYHPQQLGGTGHTLPWQQLQTFRPPIPWWLAGGLTPNNLHQALAQLQPDGIDLSSGVENAPADKNLHKVEHFKNQLDTLDKPWH